MKTKKASPPRTRLPRLLAVAALLCLAPALQAQTVATQALTPAMTAATPAVDPVLQLLHDKGVLAATGVAAATEATEPAALVQQVRDSAAHLVIASLNFLGVRYARGGSSADEGFDCSGFTRHVFEHSLGLLLPRRADEQARQAGLQPVPKTELQPGDLVFFNTLRRAFSHVGIYIGDGRFIHAPRSGAEVRIESMHESYWARRFNGARRAPMTPAPSPVRR